MQYFVELFRSTAGRVRDFDKSGVFLMLADTRLSLTPVPFTQHREIFENCDVVVNQTQVLLRIDSQFYYVDATSEDIYQFDTAEITELCND